MGTCTEFTFILAYSNNYCLVGIKTKDSFTHEHLQSLAKTHIEAELYGQSSDASFQFRLGGNVAETHRSACVAHATETDLCYVKPLSLHTHLGHILPHRVTRNTHMYTHTRLLGILTISKNFKGYFVKFGGELE